MLDILAKYCRIESHHIKRRDFERYINYTTFSTVNTSLTGTKNKIALRAWGTIGSEAVTRDPENWV